jgi:MtrB/PioB family decaheme-associated outer membrane protein
MKRSLKKNLLALAVCMALPMGTPALAEDTPDGPDKSDWVCKLCMISSGWFGSWEFGLIYVDQPTPKFADWRGLDDDGYIALSGDARFIGENGYYFDFYGRRLGLDSRSMELQGGKQGTYEYRAAYQEIPRYLGYSTTTPYVGVGTDVLTLPPGWEPADGTGVFVPATLETKRKTADAGFTYHMSRSWKFDIDVERQTRDGTYAFANGVFPFNGVAFPSPVDYTTDLIDAAIQFNGNRGQLRLGFIGSEFDNGYDSVTIDNPFSLGLGAETAESALAPDNEYAQVNLAGAYRFSRRFRVSGKAAWGEMEQNAAFLPYSTNPEFDDLTLPRTSLDGKVDTTFFNLGGTVYLKLADRLDFKGQYKAEERDNKTPVETYTPVNTDIFLSSPRTNRPYGYERSFWLAELRYRPANRVRVNLGYEQDEQERTYQEVRKTEEDGYWGDVQVAAWSWMDLRMKYEKQKRDASVIDQQGGFDRAEHPAMRKFNMADRDRDRGLIELNLYPVERMSLNFSWYSTDDEYSESAIGLTEADESALNIDFNYLIGKNTTVYVFMTKQTIDSRISGASSEAADPWTGTTEDDIRTWGMGFSGRISEKATFGLDYVSSNADGNILVQTFEGDQPPFPTLNSRMTNFRVYMDYDVNERWGWGLDAYREQYDSSDWYDDGLGPLDVSGLLTMGAQSPDYDVLVVRMVARFKF